MDFLELAKKRYSCRKISDKKVEPELIDKILEAALVAPTAINTQRFKIWVMDSPESKANIHAVTDYTFGAQNFIVLGCQKDASWTRTFDGHNFSEVDAATVGTHMMLELYDLGLASTWVGYFDAPKLQQIYPQMQDYELIGLFPFGYAAEDAHPSRQHTETRAKSEVVEVL